MKRQGVSQIALQGITGIRQHRISDYLTGKHDMGSDNLVKLLNALQLEVQPVKPKSRIRTKHRGR